MRIVSFLILVLLVGCVSEPSPVYDGYETARLHAYRGNGCSSPALEQSLWRLKNQGFSPQYRETFAQSYHRTCSDIMRRRASRQKEQFYSINPGNDYGILHVACPACRQVNHSAVTHHSSCRFSFSSIYFFSAMSQSMRKKSS